jgi:peptidoglycan/LPS O-acetylase OafA/YrhL
MRDSSDSETPVLRYSLSCPGFIITYTSKGKPIRDYIWKRVIRVYPIYWVVLLVFFIPAIFLHSAYNFALLNVFSTALLLPHHQMLNGVSWSLSFEVYFYILAGLILGHQAFGLLAGLISSGPS